MKKRQKKSQEHVVRMIIRKNNVIKRLNRRSIEKQYPELKELVEIL